MEEGEGKKKFLQAVEFATDAHKNQKRKNKQQDPYISHPLEVAKLIEDTYKATESKIDYDVLAAAVLHDVVEDTEVCIQKVAALFGNNVAGIVAQVTDNKSLSKVERKKLQRLRSSYMTTEACLIKMADKWSNCKDLKEDPPVGWTKNQVEYYFYWSYAICKTMLDSKNDTKNLCLKYMWVSKVQEVFVSFGVDPKLLSSKLTEYYDSLANQH